MVRNGISASSSLLGTDLLNVSACNVERRARQNARTEQPVDLCYPLRAEIWIGSYQEDGRGSKGSGIPLKEK